MTEKSEARAFFELRAAAQLAELRAIHGDALLLGKPADDIAAIETMARELSGLLSTVPLDASPDVVAKAWPSWMDALPEWFTAPPEKRAPPAVLDLAAPADSDNLPAVDLDAIIAKRQEKAVGEAERDAKFRAEGRPAPRGSRPRLSRRRDNSEAPLETDRESN